VGGSADWAVDATTRGLQASSPLETAILLCLFTDRRRPDTLPGETDDDADPRGWHGDTYDVEKDAGERPMGSLLWTLERAALTADTARMAEHYTREALQTLIDQGAVSRIDVETEVLTEQGQLSIAVTAWSASGQPAAATAYALNLE
jgi:phage gp46-like protein